MKGRIILTAMLCVAAVSLAAARLASAAAYSASVSGGAVMEFSDLMVYFPSDWADGSVKLAERLGIGYRDRIESYNRRLTRKELAYVAVNLYKLITGEELSLSESDKTAINAVFTDGGKNTAPFDDEVFLAIKHKLMLGTSGNEFSPDAVVTREQTAAVLYRIAERVKDMSGAPKADLSVFSDAAEISGYAYECLSVMVGAGVLTGVSSNSIAPKNVCTYEEVLSIAVRLAQLLEDELGLNLHKYNGAILEAPTIVNVHITEIDYQGKQTDILDAEWLPKEGAIGYAVDCRKPDGTILRSVTTNTGITIFEADIYESMDVYSIGAESALKTAGLIGENGASLMSPIAEDFTAFTGVYEYNDYAALLRVQVEEEIFSSFDGFVATNPKNIELKRYSSSGAAMADMSQIKVRIWKMGPNDTRIPSTASLYVHSAVAQDVIEIFEDIYNGPEKFPIYAVGGYNWRGAGSKSSHNQGLAIDINPDHNYFINTKGKILAGKMWNPSLSPYSIKPDGDVVRAFNKKGWFWAGIGWASTGKDYMHFSYTGV